MNSLCKDFILTAQRHFDSYLSGMPLNPPNPATSIREPNSRASAPPTAPGPSSNTPPPNPPPRAPGHTNTYADIANSSTEEDTSATKITDRNMARKPNRPSERPDNRLFVRIALDHPARSAGSYALLAALKRLLREDAYLLREVQETATGFALCARSANTLTQLETYLEAMTKAISNCKIEKRQEWTTYRLNYVPRSVQTFNDQGKIQNTLVTEHILSEAIRDETNQQSVRIVQATRSINSMLFNTTWFASFQTTKHTSIPRTLRILGTTVSTAVTISKPKIIQCSKCYLWHNARSCSRPQRCRICGSANHSEAEHVTRCTTAQPHTCPARCLHCSGPHAADDLNCPLRPSSKEPATKTQRLAITASSSADRKRAVIAAGCTCLERQAATPSTN